MLTFQSREHCVLLLLTWEDSVPKKLHKVAMHKKSAPSILPVSGHQLSARKLGYARVSTEEQSLSVQLEGLTKTGCDCIYQEKMSAVDARRSQLALLRKQAETGDTVITHSFSRLSHDLEQLLGIVKDFNKRGITVKSLTEPHIDPTTTSGKLVLSVTGAVDEHERGQVGDRTRRAMKQKIAEDQGAAEGQAPNVGR